MRAFGIVSIFLCATIATTTLTSSQSGREYRRSAVMNGNQVRTVFGNWGVIGQPIDTRPRGSWKNDNNGYLGDVSPFVGAEVRWQDTTFRSVVTSPVSRPSQLRDEDPATGLPWGFEPLGGYFAEPPNQSIALSNDSRTWPEAWPDKLGDPIDPGWRGSWNGFFGKRLSADLETYFVMDDNNDLRFNFAANNPRGIAFRPDTTNLSRGGLALDVSVRGLQWAQFLAQDNIFWLYEVTNTGTTNYDRAVFGMLVGTYVGVTGSDGSPQEFDDDWSFYDVNTDITFTGDFDRSTLRNPRWNQQFPVGMVGYAFLESPGNPFDGIDNDGDADSSAAGIGARQFTQADFDSSTISAGASIILIAEDFTRSTYVVPNRDSVRIFTRGLKDSIWIYPGRTRVVEGNVVRDFQGNEAVNRNAYDGVDNDFDGLIDENQFLHYRQFKRNRNPPFEVLIDVLRPVRYVTTVATNPLAMIDERRDDGVDNDQDWDPEFDDVGRDGIGPSAVNYPGPDFGEGDGLPTSGIDALGNDTGLPGEPNIDKTDVDESDQIGLSSFYYFAPANQVRLGDDEELWRNLAPGFFDVPPSIVNNKPERGEDGDFIYGSGYFPLLAGETERFSLALVYGGGKGGSRDDDIADLLKNKETVQSIYDANYQFPTPPEKPTLQVVPGDRQVTLYWDRIAEESVDPVLRIRDFEGYKIYKSTDPDFSDIYTITDGAGTARGYRALAQFDIKNDIKGYFRSTPELYQSAQGFAFYLGDDTGLRHTFVDDEVENGRRYYYAVVAYDRGDEITGIFPGENTKTIRIESTGEITTDINTAVAVPNAPSAGYIAPTDLIEMDRAAGPSSGTARYSIVDQTVLTGHRYRVEFLDTQNDGLDNNGNGLIDEADSTEWNRLTTFYSVFDTEPRTDQFISLDTASVSLERRNLYVPSVQVKTSQGAVVDPSNYILNAERGTIRGAAPGSLPASTYTITYQYYPVYKSPNIQGSPYLIDNTESDIFDGLSAVFENYWYVRDTLSRWSYESSPQDTTGPDYDFAPIDFPEVVPPFVGYRRPANYEVQFADGVVDTTAAWPDFGLDPIPVQFRVFNVTENRYVKFLFINPLGGNRISPQSQIYFLEENPRGETGPTWFIFFVPKEGMPIDTVYDLGTGDKLILNTTKPFGSGDVFEFVTELPRADISTPERAGSSLEAIRVVPNPYVTAAEFELPLPPGITSGRGERRIDFTHLPAASTIRIFTSRGDHVITLTHPGNIEDGTVSWNLKTKENLDVAYGVYFYVVESPVGNRTGKIAIIK